MTLKRAQPAPPGAWLTAKIVAGVAFGVMAYLPILVRGGRPAGPSSAAAQLAA